MVAEDVVFASASDHLPQKALDGFMKFHKSNIAKNWKIFDTTKRLL
jgi:hypothetical protein